MENKIFCRPVKDWNVTQNFGEDKCCVSNTKPDRFVYKETVQKCPVGFKSVYSQMLGHNGIDVACYAWQPIYAARDGIVKEVQTEIERGLGVGIVSVDSYGEYYKHRYWHLNAIAIKYGQEVKTGDLIGYAGSTGYSTGVHLHFEVKRCNKDGDTLYDNNGYFGAINPAPLLDLNLFALDSKGLVSQIALIKEKLALLADSVGDWLRRR